MSFFGSEEDHPNYVVVETDYVSYTVVYSCGTDDYDVALWLMSRTPTVDDEMLDRYDAIINAYLPTFDQGILMED